jgi:hypothetical protein
MMKLLAIHGLVKLGILAWHDPLNAALALLAIAAFAYVLWFLGRLIRYAWRKFRNAGPDSQISQA